MDLAAHLDAVAAHLPDRPVDVLVVHDGARPDGPGRVLHPVERHPHVRSIVRRDLLDGHDGHDPEVLGATLAELVTTPTPAPGPR